METTEAKKESSGWKSKLAAVEGQQGILGVVRAERGRLKEKYDSSFFGGRWLSFGLSQGPAHKRKIEALEQVEKELDPYLKGAGCVSETAFKALKEAYNYYPEPEDVAFRDNHLSSVKNRR